jgi:hypothetical protein
MLDYSTSAILALVGIILAFVLSVIQSLIGSKVGSDHPVHAFLIRAIRDNKNRFFLRIPNLLNNCYCAALPLYIHWILSYFRSNAMPVAERLLNPFMNAAHVIVFGAIAIMTIRPLDVPVIFVGLAICIFALTPQFYHALSARNFGLSARGVGLLLLTVFFFSGYCVETGTSSILFWSLLIISSCLVWCFSTFAAQAMCIISFLLMLTGFHTVTFVGALLGMLIFVGLHPKYSLGYLQHTLRFIYAYATELAPIYILSRRKSIWRDLIWDIWINFGSGMKNGVRYAYENSILVVIILNPLVPVSCWASLSHSVPDTGLIGYAGAVTLAGMLAAVLTSFRLTRFLGEPERYIEAVTPWAVIVGAYYFQLNYGVALLMSLVVIFFLMDIVQLYLSKLLANYISNKPINLVETEKIIEKQLGRNVRFCSNNEQITKRLMLNDWRFAYCMTVGQDYCSMKVQEAFSIFPHLRREACQRIVSTYQINACVLDRTLYDTLFNEPIPGLESVTVAYESEGIRLLILKWEGRIEGSHSLRRVGA